MVRCDGYGLVQLNQQVTGQWIFLSQHTLEQKLKTLIVHFEHCRVCRINKYQFRSKNEGSNEAAFQFALKADEGLIFLRLWNEGEFDVLRAEWPEAPEEIYNGAELLYKPKSNEEQFLFDKLLNKWTLWEWYVSR